MEDFIGILSVLAFAELVIWWHWIHKPAKWLQIVLIVVAIMAAAIVASLPVLFLLDRWLWSGWTSF